MSAGTSQILVWVESPRACIRVVGRAAVEGARQFKMLIQRLEAQGIHQFCVDLGECRIMDSTFSGVLAALAGGPDASAGGTGGARFTVINPNARVRDLLDNLGVLPLVRVIEGTTLTMPGGGVEEISPSASSRSETTRCCLEAHQFLMDLKPENRQRFAEVARLLEEQLGT
jgi:anti-sigma B factor antagonist